MISVFVQNTKSPEKLILSSNSSIGARGITIVLLKDWEDNTNSLETHIISNSKSTSTRANKITKSYLFLNDTYFFYLLKTG